MSYKTNNKDIMYSDYRLYIEGIQVPFRSISITQAYKQPPSATISIPPFPGLCEIGRNYQPKVHVFFKDHNSGVPDKSVVFSSEEDRLASENNGYKLIFSGIITSNSDSKSVSAYGGSQNMTLTAEHTSVILDQILFKYSNASQASRSRLTDSTNSSGIAVIGESNSGAAIILALQGIENGGSLYSGDKVNIRYDHGNFERLKGIPSAMVVIWNMLKRDSKSGHLSTDTEALTDMYIPLVEDGMKFWKKVTGHSLIEEGTSNIKVKDTEVHQVDTEDNTRQTMVPPMLKSFIGDAAQVKATQSAAANFGAGSPSEEVLSYGEHMASMLESMDYEMITLASPIVKKDGTITEYIVKPTLPTYYAPICNVLLPNMITNVSVNNGYREVPTRINCIQNSIAGGDYMTTGTRSYNYSAPNSVRVARAGPDSDLSQTTVSFANRVGRFEWGQGIKARTTQMPSIYALLQSIMAKRELDGETDINIADTANYGLAVSAWNNMYPDAKKFNPLRQESNIRNFQRMPFLYVDSLFASSTAAARSASVQGVFNPYAVVGYPMDIVDAAPSRESYHGMCISITHSISADGAASTSYQLGSVSTFAELAKFNLPAVNPYLMAVLGFEDDVRIYGNTKAYEEACKLYAEVFEVGAAEPSFLQNYDTGTIRKIFRKGGFWGIDNAGVGLDSVLDSLSLVARNIQSLSDVEDDTGNKFISIDSWKYLDPAKAKHMPSHYRVRDASISNGKISTPGLDIESSPFLDYDEPI